MKLQDQSNGRCTKRIKCEGIYNDHKGGRSLKQMIGWINLGRTNYRIKFIIYSTMLLHSKEGWVTAIGTRLPEIKPVYDKEQDAITFN